MGIFGNLFDPVSPMPWEMGDVPGRKQSLRLEDIYDITPSAESKYPESVWAPPPGKPIILYNLNVKAYFELERLAEVRPRIHIQIHMSLRNVSSLRPVDKQ